MQAYSGNSQHLLVHSLSVGLPVQPVVDANMQVFKVLNPINIPGQDAQSTLISLIRLDYKDI